MRWPMEKDQSKEAGKELRQEEEEETEGKERRRGRRSRLLPVPRKREVMKAKEKEFQGGAVHGADTQSDQEG